MLSYVLRRLVASVALIFGVLVAVFFALRIAGADPARVKGGVFASDEVMQAYREQYGTDSSLISQFGTFLSELGHGRLGTSFRFEESVVALIWDAAPKTLLLAGTSLVIIVLLSALLGVGAAVRQGGWADRAIIGLTVLGLSIPTFFVGVVMVLLFAVQLGWLPAGGLSTWRSLCLPVAAVVLVELPWQLRVVRAEMVDVLRSDYMETARAYGLSPFRMYFVYGLRNAAVPWLSVFGIQAGALLGGTIVAEVVFDYPGLGSLLVQAVGAGDYPLVQGITVVIATLFVLFNLLADLLQTVVDPRVRL